VLKLAPVELIEWTSVRPSSPAAVSPSSPQTEFPTCWPANRQQLVVACSRGLSRQLRFRHSPGGSGLKGRGISAIAARRTWQMLLPNKLTIAYWQASNPVPPRNEAPQRTAARWGANTSSHWVGSRNAQSSSKSLAVYLTTTNDAKPLSSARR
jgi:hypothetical protein